MFKYFKWSVIGLSVALISAVALCGCGNAKDVEIPELAGEPIKDNLNSEQDTVNAQEDISESTDGVYASVADIFKYADESWNESEAYIEAVMAYDEASKDGSFEDPGYGSIKYYIAYIDEDDIPELLYGYGTEHIAGITVCTYDYETKQVVRIGEFGSYGSISIAEKKNRILSSYGNQGLFHFYVSSMTDYKPVLVDVLCIDGGGMRYEGDAYFHNPQVPNLDGTRDSGGGEDPDYHGDYEEEWLISEEEYNRILAQDMCTSLEDLVYVHYDNMYGIKAN